MVAAYRLIIEDHLDPHHSRSHLGNLYRFKELRGGGLRVIQRSCKACFGERDRDHDAYDEKK